MRSVPGILVLGSEPLADTMRMLQTCLLPASSVSSQGQGQVVVVVGVVVEGVHGQGGGEEDGSDADGKMEEGALVATYWDRIALVAVVAAAGVGDDEVGLGTSRGWELSAACAWFFQCRTQLVVTTKDPSPFSYARLQPAAPFELCCHLVGGRCSPHLPGA